MWIVETLRVYRIIEKRRIVRKFNKLSCVVYLECGRGEEFNIEERGRKG